MLMAKSNFYDDKITKSIDKAIKETDRRRNKQFLQ